MTSTGSISVSGLLGGTAGQIDTKALISQLMTAAAVPQTQLQTQLTGVDSVRTAYRAINTALSAVQTAAQELTGNTAWQATSASSSSGTVAATSTTSATAGLTTFSVTQLARGQVSTVAADSSGSVVADPANGITVTGADGTAHAISLTSGSATDVAKAINQAAVGVRASVITTDQGSVLQLVSSKTGAANSFTASGFTNTQQNLITAQDAKVSVGDQSSGGYTVSSASNTFAGFIPGVTFSVSALATDVTISVASDQQSVTSKVSTLVSAANAALSGIAGDTAQGGILQGRSDVRSLTNSVLSAVSNGTTSGVSLKSYGIDIDDKGAMSFDADAFAKAYAADPAGTQAAISSSFAAKLNTVSTAATDTTNGSLTQTISSLGTQEDRLGKQIDTWTTRLGKIQDNLTAKYTAMETALSKLQSQQTYLTSMFKSLDSSDSSSSS